MGDLEIMTHRVHEAIREMVRERPDEIVQSMHEAAMAQSVLLAELMRLKSVPWTVVAALEGSIEALGKVQAAAAEAYPGSVVRPVE